MQIDIYTEDISLRERYPILSRAANFHTPTNALGYYAIVTLSDSGHIVGELYLSKPLLDSVLSMLAPYLGLLTSSYGGTE